MIYPGLLSEALKLGLLSQAYIRGLCPRNIFYMIHSGILPQEFDAGLAAAQDTSRGFCPRHELGFCPRSTYDYMSANMGSCVRCCLLAGDDDLVVINDGGVSSRQT